MSTDWMEVDNGGGFATVEVGLLVWTRSSSGDVGLDFGVGSADCVVARSIFWRGILVHVWSAKVNGGCEWDEQPGACNVFASTNT